MPFPVVVINDFTQTLTGDIILKATPENVIEDRPLNRRFYTFNMVITKPFSYQNQSRLILTDNASADEYLLIDRLGKPIIAEELEGYASTRRCIASQFDSVTKTIRILSCICPTNKYIEQWLTPPATTTSV